MLIRSLLLHFLLVTETVLPGVDLHSRIHKALHKTRNNVKKGTKYTPRTSPPTGDSPNIDYVRVNSVRSKGKSVLEWREQVLGVRSKVDEWEKSMTSQPLPEKRVEKEGHLTPTWKEVEYHHPEGVPSVLKTNGAGPLGAWRSGKPPKKLMAREWSYPETGLRGIQVCKEKVLEKLKSLWKGSESHGHYELHSFTTEDPTIFAVGRENAESSKKGVKRTVIEGAVYSFTRVDHGKWRISPVDRGSDGFTTSGLDPFLHHYRYRFGPVPDIEMRTIKELRKRLVTPGVPKSVRRELSPKPSAMTSHLSTVVIDKSKKALTCRLQELDYIQKHGVADESQSPAEDSTTSLLQPKSDLEVFLRPSLSFLSRLILQKDMRHELKERLKPFSEILAFQKADVGGGDWLRAGETHLTALLSVDKGLRKSRDVGVDEGELGMGKTLLRTRVKMFRDWWFCDFRRGMLEGMGKRGFLDRTDLEHLWDYESADLSKNPSRSTCFLSAIGSMQGQRGIGRGMTQLLKNRPQEKPKPQAEDIRTTTKVSHPQAEDIRTTTKSKSKPTSSSSRTKQIELETPSSISQWQQIFTPVKQTILGFLEELSPLNRTVLILLTVIVFHLLLQFGEKEAEEAYYTPKRPPTIRGVHYSITPVSEHKRSQSVNRRVSENFNDYVPSNENDEGPGRESDKSRNASLTSSFHTGKPSSNTRVSDLTRKTESKASVFHSNASVFQRSQSNLSEGRISGYYESAPVVNNRSRAST